MCETFSEQVFLGKKYKFFRKKFWVLRTESTVGRCIIYYSCGYVKYSWNIDKEGYLMYSSKILFTWPSIFFQKFAIESNYLWVTPFLGWTIYHKVFITLRSCNSIWKTLRYTRALGYWRYSYYHRVFLQIKSHSSRLYQWWIQPS